jgi:hypothetical protein
MSGVSMRLESGRIVIDDSYVCGFAGRAGFLETCGVVIRAMCDALARAERPCADAEGLRSELGACLARSHGELADEICTRLSRAQQDVARVVEERVAVIGSRVDAVASSMRGEIADEMCARVGRAQPDVAGVLTGALTRIVDERVAMQRSMEKLEAAIGSRVDASAGAVARFKEELASEIRGGGALADVSSALSLSLARLSAERDEMRKMVDRVCCMLDDRASSNRRKGDTAEVGLVEVLESIMTAREGFAIHRVGTIPHNCDILIRKQGKPDVRVECKAHGKDNGKPVSNREVGRFEDDLKLLRNHGIFVSLYAPITGKDPFELRMLESNRVAIYLSNNQFDGAMIRDLVLLIYRVDELIHADGIVLTPGQLCHIRAGLDDVGMKASQIQAHLRASLELVGSMCVDSVARMLTDVTVASDVDSANPIPVPGTGKRGRRPKSAVA